jgi:hypothetical protein
MKADSGAVMCWPPHQEVGGHRRREVERRRLVTGQQVRVAGEPERGRVGPSARLSWRSVPWLRWSEAKVWRNVWKPAQGASTSSASGFNARRRRLFGSIGLPSRW